MNNAIVLHGVEENYEEYMQTLKERGSEIHLHWYPWIQNQLLQLGILAQTPEMPAPYFTDMNYADWEKIINGFDINENTVLIGHSAGGGFWVEYLSKHPDIKVKQLIMVAPWLDPNGETKGFYNFEFDKTLSDRVGKMDIFYSTDDMDMIIKSAEKIITNYPKTEIHKFKDKGHFTLSCLGGREFPELLESVIK
ncbi:MAG: alpha/beta hydrolase [Rickettsiales bacterium]|jgi:predicted alpha/beta hydrolase family esterase|nr:alpha/beta hydrolase [Rickettsiales bacterium]